MVEFALPKNSKISGGKAWPKPQGAAETREFNVYRWNPDDGKNPSVDTYHIDNNAIAKASDDDRAMALQMLEHWVQGRRD